MSFYAYAAQSHFSDSPSIKDQVTAIKARATALGEDLAKCFVEPEQAPEDPLFNRPAFKDFLAHLDTGDHLIIYRFRDFATRRGDLPGAFIRMSFVGVTLHTTAEPGDQLDMDPSACDTFVRHWKIFKAVHSADISVRTRKAMHARKARGEVYYRTPSIGKRRVTKRSRGRVTKHDAWDETECSLVREIHARHVAGESFESIAEDFFARRLKRPDGTPWVTRPKWKKNLRTATIKWAFHRYVELLAKGRDLPVEADA